MKKAEVEKPGVINLNETSIPKVKSNEVLIEIYTYFLVKIPLAIQ